MFKTIQEERMQRINGLTNPDPVAWEIWERALTNCDVKTRQKLINIYNIASSIKYHHSNTSSEVYFAHPLRVAALSFIYSGDSDAAIIGLLHNILEVADGGLSYISNKLEPIILIQIQSLNVNRKYQWDIKYNLEYFSRLQNGPRAAIVVKVFDKLDNLFVLGLNPDDMVREKYLAHFEKFMLPMISSQTPDLLNYAIEMISDARRVGFIQI
jgi:(p)ppGpp synthase/HD superfamily hydrolase